MSAAALDDSTPCYRSCLVRDGYGLVCVERVF